MIFARLGNIQLGTSSVMAGPTAATETLVNDFHEHKVVRGKPVPQRGGEALDRRSFSFFFDESFCNPEAEYARLVAAKIAGDVMPFIPGGGGFNGKNYFIKQIKGTTHKTSVSGRVVRIAATLELVEVPNGALSIGATGIAGAAVALLNPLLKRLR
ncbi:MULTISPECIES: phage tail protein [Stappiaceae]|uniref:phage tail protein n=1 Tax=Stappiaceae TaxID=2821832 RepID=UPI000C9A1EA2|nr:MULTISPECIES: phage tail protein [Pseudovibrio]MDD7908642.1 phage tail protein [Pseudovibrio exalbescens]MDX5595322.1 phage tail protein [Pseudovibrio sp. SPO723]